MAAIDTTGPLFPTHHHETMNEETLGCALRSLGSPSPAHPRVEQRRPEHPPSPCHLSQPPAALPGPALRAPLCKLQTAAHSWTARHPGSEGGKRRLTRVPSPAPSPLPSAPDGTRSPGSTPAVTSCFTPAHVALHRAPPLRNWRILPGEVFGSQPSVRAGKDAGGQKQSPPLPHKATNAEQKA